MSMKRTLARKALEKGADIFLSQLAKDGEVGHTFEFKSGGVLAVELDDLGDGDGEILLNLSWSFGAHRGAITIPVPVGDLGELD